MNSDNTLLLPLPSPTELTAAQFVALATVPAEDEWFANLGNQGTRLVYEPVIRDFMRFAGITTPAEFRNVIRAHVIAWRDDLHARTLAAATIRRYLARLSSLFDYHCDKNAVAHNPVDGAKQPPVDSYKGKTPALGDAQARPILDFPAGDSLKDKRDRAILSTLLYHAMRRGELRKLAVKTANSCCAECRTSGFPARAARPALCPYIRLRKDSSLIIRKPQDMATMTAAHCSGRCIIAGTIQRAASRRMGSISWCGNIRPRSAFRLGHIVCDRRPRPTL